MTTIEIRVDPRPRTPEAFEWAGMVACGEMPSRHKVLDAIEEVDRVVALVRFEFPKPAGKPARALRDWQAATLLGVA